MAIARELWNESPLWLASPARPGTCLSLSVIICKLRIIILKTQFINHNHHAPPKKGALRETIVWGEGLLGVVSPECSSICIMCKAKRDLRGKRYRALGRWAFKRLRRLEYGVGMDGRIRALRVWNLKNYPDFLEGFQQAQTVTKVTRRKMPPVDKMM